MTKAAAYGSRLAYGSTYQAFTVAAATNLFTATAHGIIANQPVMIRTAGYTAGTPLLARRVYFARDITANTFAVALTPGGAAIDVTVDGSGSVAGLADLAQVSSLSGPNLQAQTIDVTTHDSPSAVREFVAGLIDPGEFSGELVFDPNLATHMAAWTGLLARTNPVSFALIFPTTLAYSIGFEGQFTGLGPVQAQPDTAVTAGFTVKISGLPVTQT